MVRSRSCGQNARWTTSGIATPQRRRPAWIAGAIGGFVAGGSVGFVLDGRHCDCERARGFVIGGALGAVAGGWIVARLTR